MQTMLRYFEQLDQIEPTHHQKEAVAVAVVVVVAANEFKKLRSPKETPLAFFSRFKGHGLDLAWRKDLPRKIEA